MADKIKASCLGLWFRVLRYADYGVIWAMSHEKISFNTCWICTCWICRFSSSNSPMLFGVRLSSRWSLFFSQPKNTDVFLSFYENTQGLISQGISNEYPQHTFPWRNDEALLMSTYSFILSIDTVCSNNCWNGRVVRRCHVSYVTGGVHLILAILVCLFVLRFYGPVNPMGSCRAWSVYLTTRLLGRLSPLSG